MTPANQHTGIERRYPCDEFEWPKDRAERYPTLALYLASRSDDEIAALIWNRTYQSNIFGTYDGTNGDHARTIIAALSLRASAEQQDHFVDATEMVGAEPGDWVLVPREPTPEMLKAGMDDLNWWIEPYEAPRESGVPIGQDVSAEDAAFFNGQQIDVIADAYRAIVSAAPTHPHSSSAVDGRVTEEMVQAACDAYYNMNGFDWARQQRMGLQAGNLAAMRAALEAALHEAQNG